MSNLGDSTVSRRGFAKAATVGSFAVLSAKTGKAQENGETLKVGLLGCGGRGRGAAKNHLDGCENVKLVAMADIFEDKLKSAKVWLERIKDPKVASKVDIDPDKCFVGVDAYKKILETDIDILIHATTPYVRPTHIEAAVKAGKHIFTEKPAATDTYGINQFIAASQEAEKKKLCIVAGTQRRHQKSYVDTIKKIQDGEIGDVLSARAYWCGSLPFVHERKDDWSDLEDRLRNWYAHCWVCGDNIVEQHVHNLDIINWVMGGPPKSVFASGGRAWRPSTEAMGDHWDHFSCDYEYEGGQHMMSMSRHWTRTEPGKKRVSSDGGVFEEVTGTKGVSNCRDMGKDNQDPYVQEHMDLVAAIRVDAPYINEGVRVAESTFTAILGRDSAYTGRKLSYAKHLKANDRLTPEKLDFDADYPIRPFPVPGF